MIGSGTALALWMTHGIVHNVTYEPPARAFLQVCTVHRTIRRIAIGSLGNSFDDVRGCHIRRLLTVRHARSTQVVFGIDADAHGRKLVLPVNHFVQRPCKARGAAPVKDHMGNRIHRRVPRGLAPLSRRIRSRCSDCPSHSQTLPFAILLAVGPAKDSAHALLSEAKRPIAQRPHQCQSAHSRSFYHIEIYALPSMFGLRFLHPKPTRRIVGYRHAPSTATMSVFDAGCLSAFALIFKRPKATLC